MIERSGRRGVSSPQSKAAALRGRGERLLGPLPFPAAVENGAVDLDGVAVPLTHLTKLFFPADGIRKRELLDYTNDVAEYLVPHLRNRPYTLKRYPNGIDGKFFFQKESGERMPKWVPICSLPSRGERGHINFVLCNDRPTLLYLVNLGCVDHNAWMSRADTPAAPDFVLLDLDPGPRAGFERVIRVMQEVRKVLDQLEIFGLPKTSGATGMHAFIPLAPGHTYAQSARFARLLLRYVARALPEITTEIWALGERPQDRVFLDYRQNAQGKTVPPPYSPRPRPCAPVSTPLHWREVEPRLDPSQFTIRNVRRRLDRYGDLFAGALPAEGRGQSIANLLKRMEAPDRAA